MTSPPNCNYIIVFIKCSIPQHLSSVLKPHTICVFCKGSSVRKHTESEIGRIISLMVDLPTMGAGWLFLTTPGQVKLFPLGNILKTRNKEKPRNIFLSLLVASKEKNCCTFFVKNASFLGLFLGLKKKWPANGYTSSMAVGLHMAQSTTWRTYLQNPRFGFWTFWYMEVENTRNCLSLSSLIHINTREPLATGFLHIMWFLMVALDCESESHWLSTVISIRSNVFLQQFLHKVCKFKTFVSPEKSEM